jgi:putative oxidoreductase
MRLVAGFTLMSRGITGLWGEPPPEPAAANVLAIGVGMLLAVGLWTPFAGALAAAVELWCTFFWPGDRLTNILLVTLVAAVALIGPGAWSLDARLFGWKRIDIRNRQG